MPEVRTPGTPEASLGVIAQYAETCLRANERTYRENAAKDDRDLLAQDRVLVAMLDLADALAAGWSPAQGAGALCGVEWGLSYGPGFPVASYLGFEARHVLRMHREDGDTETTLQCRGVHPWRTVPDEALQVSSL